MATESVTPDQARIDFGETVDSIGGGVDAVGARLGAVVRALWAQGMASGATKPTGINLVPEVAPGNPETIAGYPARESLAVTVANLGAVGADIDRAMAAGANAIEGITFLPAHP
ncbi:MAG: SIMPL domain-containing protein [Firmicutes bacterium]|nr:SIMPL domain-containing protein [Alicyclobacillaceae bacterium]MCL6497409.1 SIMPL domain-containing protein [Bacillota bacterium]